MSEDEGGEDSCMMAAMDSARADVPPVVERTLVRLGGGHTWNHAHYQHCERAHDEQLDLHGTDSTSLLGVV